MKIILLIVIFGALLTGGHAQELSRDTGKFTLQSVFASISVADLDRALAWYGVNFGFRKVKELKFPPDVRIGFVENGSLTLELAELKGAIPFGTVKEKIAAIRDRSSLQGLYKIGFFVADLESESERLKENGVKFLYGPSTDEGSGDSWLIVEDPDGNLVQMIQRGTGAAHSKDRR